MPNQVDLKEKAREILAREEHKHPRPGTNDEMQPDHPDPDHPDQRGHRAGDPGHPEPRR